MSTRSIIVVTGTVHGRPKTIRLYKHSDGYPTGTLPAIESALEKAVSITTKANAEWSENEKPINPELVVGQLIGVCSDEYGMGAYLEETYFERFKPIHLGPQADLEWIYVIDTDKQTVNIYGGGYTGQAPQHAYKKGTVDPLNYVKQLKEERQRDCKFETEKLIRYIEAWSFKVNPKSNRKPRSKAKPTELKVVE